MVGNLLDNAERHAEGLVAVSVAAEAGGVREEVCLDDARSRDDGGTGLGLARDGATRHGGTLTVHRVPESGAAFRLWLPRAA